MEQHPEAHIRTVASIAVHGLCIGHAAQRRGQVKAHRLEHLMQHALHHGHHIVFRDEGHLDIHLRELRLAVSAQVLIAEAASDLEVALDAARHEHLLELLRRLRKRVERARAGTAGYDVVAGALRRGVRQDGRLHLDESALVERAAQGLGDPVAQVQILVHLGTAKVQIAPLHARGLVGLDAVLDGERRRDGGVQHLQRAGEHLDLARGHIGVDGIGGTHAHRALHPQHELAAEMLGRGEVVGTDAIGVDHDLGVAGAVAQVDEDQAAVVAVVPGPAGQHDVFAVVRRTQLAARRGMHGVLVHEAVIVVGHGSPRYECRAGAPRERPA